MLFRSHDATYTDSRVENDGAKNTFNTDAVSLKESTERDSEVLNKADVVAEQDAAETAGGIASAKGLHGEVALLSMSEHARVHALIARHAAEPESLDAAKYLNQKRLSLRAGEVTAINNALQSVLDNIAAERAQVATAHNNDVTVTIAGEKTTCDTRATDNYDLSVKALQNDVDQANTELSGDGANLGSIKEESIASAANDLAKMDYDTASELLDAGKAKRTREIAAANARQSADNKAADTFHTDSVNSFNNKRSKAITYLNEEQALLKVIRTALAKAGLLFDGAHPDTTTEFVQMGATAAIKHMTLMATRLARHRAGLDPTEASKIQSAETNRVNDAEAKKFRDVAVAQNAKQQSEGAATYTKTEIGRASCRERV